MPIEFKDDILVPRSRAIFSLTANQTTDINAGDHVKFNNTVFSEGANISLDSVSAYVTTLDTDALGRFTLAGGFSYRIMAGLILNSSAADLINYVVYDADSGAQVGTRASTAATTYAQNFGMVPFALAFVSPSADTRYEVRLEFELNLTTILAGANDDSSWVAIEQW